MEVGGDAERLQDGGGEHDKRVEVPPEVRGHAARPDGRGRGAAALEEVEQGPVFGGRRRLRERVCARE